VLRSLPHDHEEHRQRAPCQRDHAPSRREGRGRRGARTLLEERPLEERLLEEGEERPLEERLLV